MAEETKIVRWSKTAVTDIGTSLLADYAAGRILDITSAYGSICEPGDDPVTLEELPDGRTHPLTIESVTKTANSVTACVQVTSLGNNVPYKLERIGLFAVSRDPGEPKPSDGTPIRNDKLLMVVEDVEDENGSKGVTVPAESDQLYTFKLYVVLTITNKDRLEVSVSSAGIATIGAIKDMLDQHNEAPEAHKKIMEEIIKAHNAGFEAHAPLTARIRAMELALNGKETIIQKADPTTETEGAKGQHYINLETGNEFVCNDITDDGYIWGKADTKTSLRDLLAQTADMANKAKEVADGAAKAIAAVQNTISVVPAQAGSLTYNKERQKPIWDNLALEMMDITYGEDRTPAKDYQGETDAGTYKAYVTPKADYTWGDKSRDEKEIPWTIQRAIVAAVPSVSGALTYNGSAQAPVWQNYNPEKLDKEEAAQTDAGEHSTRFTPTKNYQWSGGDTSAKVVKWTIAKAANTFSVVPSGAQSVDVGNMVVIQVTSNSDAQITATADNPASVEVTADAANKRVTIKGVGQGSANVTISSRGSANYADASAVVGVNVRRKTPSLSINPSGNQSLSIGGNKQIAIITDSDGAVSARSSVPGVATASVSGKNAMISGASVGSAVITISVAQTTKYNAASATVSVSVVKPTVANSTWDEIRAISDAGTAASYFAPGDTKRITINGTVQGFTFSNVAVDAFIIGFDHNSTREGTNRIHFMVGKIDGKDVALCDSRGAADGKFYMNQSNSNAGGWNGSYMRKTLLGNSGTPSSPPANSLLAAFPADLRAVMKPITKYTDNTGGGSDDASYVTATTDYLSLAAPVELFGLKGAANSAEVNYQKQYDYFKAGNSCVAYNHIGAEQSMYWWQRSPRCSTKDGFAVVNNSGTTTQTLAGGSAGVRPIYSV